MRRCIRLVALAVVVLVGLAGTSCARHSSQAAGRLNVTGQAEVTSTDGGQRVVTHALTLRSGEQVRIVGGTATLGLGGGRQLELRKDSTVRLVVQPGTSETRGELIVGDVLVTSSTGAATVVAGDTTVRVTGAARVSRRLAVVVATYEGASGVESAGKAQAVPALRQVTVPAPGLPSRATPLSFSAADSWDQRYLGDSVDLGNQLVARSHGFTAQLAAGQDTGEGFLREILPGLRDQPFDASLIDASLAPGETLVGAAITLEGTKGQFRERWTSVFGFHDEGAPWGLVALDQGVARGPLLASVDAATGRIPGLATQGATSSAAGGGTVQVPVPIPVPVPSTPTTVAPSGSQSAAPGPTSPSSPSTGTNSPTQPTQPTQPSPSTGSSTPAGPINLGVPVVDDTLNAVVNLLSGLLKTIGGPQ